jgi:LPS-assembly lipoprotein
MTIQSVLRALLVFPLVFGFLVSCGFQPVYGPGGTGGKLQNQIRVAEPQDRNGYLLVRRIEERLGRADAATYQLNLTLQTREEGLGIDPDGNIDRFNLIGVAGYVLIDAQTNAQVTSGTVNSFSGYSATGSTVETLASERDARERLMVILGDQIVARLLSAPL